MPATSNEFIESQQLKEKKQRDECETYFWAILCLYYDSSA